MGTKNNPSKYDCYAKAENDEPMFILLARDPIASTIVRIWIFIRALVGKADLYQDSEAEQCAYDMETWRKRQHN